VLRYSHVTAARRAVEATALVRGQHLQSELPYPGLSPTPARTLAGSARRPEPAPSHQLAGDLLLRGRSWR